MSGIGGTIFKRDPKGNVVNVGNQHEIKKLIAETFPGTKWNKEPFVNRTAEFGRYYSGGGAVVFGMFNKSKDVLETIDLEIRGRISDAVSKSVSKFCERNGWEITADNSYEEEVLSGASGDQKHAGTIKPSCATGKSACLTGGALMQALEEAKRRACARG
jgi:hypothetical protein